MTEEQFLKFMGILKTINSNLAWGFIGTWVLLFALFLEWIK